MNTQFVNRMARNRSLTPRISFTAMLLLCLVCIVTPSRAANDWSLRGGPEGGLIANGAVDPFDSNVAYVTNSAGIFKTTNGGTSWTSLNAYWGADAKVLIDPTNPNTVYIASGLVIKSTDAGAHWTILNTKTSCTDFVWALVIDPKSTSTLYVIMGSSSGTQLNYYVLKSTDGGSNWTRLTWTAYGLAVDPTNDTILYASTTAGLQKSTNGGSTWSPAGTGLPPPSPTAHTGTVVVDPKNPNNLYVVQENTVYKSTNGGGQWSNSNTGISGAGLKDPVIDPINPGTLYEVTLDATSGLGDIFKTTNGGGQWSLLNLGIPNASAQFVALGASNTATLYSGTLSNGVLKSVNSGTSWAADNTGLKADDNQMVLDPTNKNNIYLGIIGLGVFQSTDGGSNWVSRNSGLPSLQVAALAISPVNPQTLYVSLNNAVVMSVGGIHFSLPGIFKSTNGGGSWTTTTTPPDNFGFTAPMRLAADPVDANGIYAVGLASGVYHSTDGGSSWNVSKAGLPTTAIPYSFVIDPETPANLYLGMESATGSSQLVYKSTDSGSTWTASGSGLPNAAAVWDIAIDPKTPTTLYAAVIANLTVNGGVYKSMNSGGSWTEADNGLSNFDWESLFKIYFDNLTYSGGIPICPSYLRLSALHLAVDPINPATLFSVVNGVVFRSTDSAGSWSLASSGLFYQPSVIAVSPADDTAVYAASLGVYVYKSSGGTGGTNSITVSSPNGGESWVVGSTHNITWSNSGTVGNVHIDYSTDGGTTWTEVAHVPNSGSSGSYTWTVPNTPSTTVKIRISNDDGTISDTSDGNFTITSGTGCTFAISPASKSFTPAGGTGSVSVAAGSGCSWTATSNASWITITSGATGSGNGTVSYTVAAASSGGLRTGTMTIAGMTFTVTEGQSSGTSADRFVPIVLSSGGAGGSFYTTELTADNKGTGTVEVDLTYTGASALGGGSGTASISLPPGQMIISDSITFLVNHGVPLASSGNRGGTLRAHFSNLASASDASITARTTTLVNDSGGHLIGRAGLAYAAIPVGESSSSSLAGDSGTSTGRADLTDSVSLSATALNGTAYVCGLRQNATDRSNVAFQNAGAAGDGSITLQVTVYDGDTSSPHVLPPIILDPGAFSQISGVLTSNGLSLANGYIKVQRTAGTAPYYTYGVINDQVNSDGSFVTPQPAGAAAIAGLTLPVIVQTSTFISELVLTNFSTQARILNFVFYADALTTPDKTARFSITVPAGRQQIIPDIFAYMRNNGVAGVGPAGTTIAGALFATAVGGDISGVVVGARTSAAGVGVGGRFGLFYSAVPYGQASTTDAWVFGLQQNSENRTNLAIVNTGETDANSDTFVIDLYDGATGTKVKSMDPIVVPAHGWIQIGTVLTNAPGVQQGYAQVRRTSGTNPFISYAVINDGANPGQRTGDGAYMGSSQ